MKAHHQTAMREDELKLLVHVQYDVVTLNGSDALSLVKSAKDDLETGEPAAGWRFGAPSVQSSTGQAHHMAQFGRRNTKNPLAPQSLRWQTCHNSADCTWRPTE